MLETTATAADLLSMAARRTTEPSAAVVGELAAALDVLIEAGAVIVVP